MARVLAQRSLCVRDQVGAIIVDRDDKVIGEGYNGPARYTKHDQRPCTEWCPRASAGLKIIGWSGGSFPGGLEVSDEGIYHLWDGYAQGRMEIPDENAFMLSHGAIPVYEDEKKADYSDCPSLHAEANALMASDRSLRVGGTIYVTSHPCMSCAKLIANSGLTGVFVGHDGTHEYRRDPAVYGYLMNLGTRVWEYTIDADGRWISA